MIVRVRVVLKRTVVDLSGSHDQSQVNCVCQLMMLYKCKSGLLKAINQLSCDGIG